MYKRKPIDKKIQGFLNVRYFSFFGNILKLKRTGDYFYSEKSDQQNGQRH